MFSFRWGYQSWSSAHPAVGIWLKLGKISHFQGSIWCSEREGRPLSLASLAVRIMWARNWSGPSLLQLGEHLQIQRKANGMGGSCWHLLNSWIQLCPKSALPLDVPFTYTNNYFSCPPPPRLFMLNCNGYVVILNWII